MISAHCLKITAIKSYRDNYDIKTVKNNGLYRSWSKLSGTELKQNKRGIILKKIDKNQNMLVFRI